MSFQSQESGHSKRLIGEQLSQIAMVLVGLLDRLILTAVLFRAWDRPVFEAWSVCLAIAGLISLFEFGFNMYFNNRLMIETESGNSVAAKQTYFLCNSILGASSFLGYGAVVASFSFLPMGKTLQEGGAEVAVLILCLGNAARIAVSGAYSQYRANRQYSRLVWILTAGELLRVSSAILAVFAGGGLIAVSAVSTAAQLLVTVLFVLIDTNHRFSPHSFGFVFPRWRSVREILSMSSAFYAQMLSIILLTSLPVLVLNYLGVGIGMLAAFVLLRTLSGLSRAPMQALGIVLGQECGRRLAVREADGAFSIFLAGAHFFAAFSGLATGFLFVAGSDLVKIWTGDAKVFDFHLMLAAILPMAIASTSILAHNVLAASNAPYFAAVGRWTQVGITGIFFIFAPIPDLTVRMMLALAIGEVFGFAPFAYIAVARLMPAAAGPFQLKLVGQALFASIVGAAITKITATILGLESPLRIFLWLALSLSICGAAMLWLGLNHSGRQRLMNYLVGPFLVKIGVLIGKR